MTTTGVELGTFNVVGAGARDWEDMAIAPDPVTGDSYLYLGDIGDNNFVRSTIDVYRVAEPVVDAQQPVAGAQFLFGAERFRFQYPDGARDAETLMVDPTSGDLYIISKRDPTPRIYRAPFPQSTVGTTTLEFVGLVDWDVATTADWPTAGEISPDGSEVLLRSYVDARLWSVEPGESLGDVLATPGTSVPLAFEPQGETIAFDATGANYHTVSEGVRQPIYFYQRIPEPASAGLASMVLAAAIRVRRRVKPTGKA